MPGSRTHGGTSSLQRPFHHYFPQITARYGLYSSRSRGTWACKPHLVRSAPEGCRREHEQRSSVRRGDPAELCEDPVSARESRAARARLLAKVYEVDLLCCRRCGSPMKVLAHISDPRQVRRILRHLTTTGGARGTLDEPPGAPGRAHGAIRSPVCHLPVLEVPRLRSPSGSGILADRRRR